MRRPNRNLRVALWLLLAAELFGLASASLLAEAATNNNLLAAALDSITGDELYKYVEVLADDVYEGREAGTRGGHAAGQFIVNELKNYGLAPLGTNGEFLQPFDDDWRNILALLPGDDPALAHEVIVVGAHYDHVGYGRRANSFGPAGQIHNGADDNASGVSLLLETIEAFATSGLRTRRPVMFAFWDGEERGLVGSKYWVANPTVPLDDVKLNITIDMVGRLRNEQLFVFGTRTGYGLRRLMSGTVDDPLWLDFTWDLRADSDHWSFLERRIPVIMLHTGLHSDYHRPSDDVEKINREGMREVGRYLLASIIRLANEEHLPAYREYGRRESNSTRRSMERPLEKRSLANWPADTPRPKLGISWREDVGEPNSVIITRVVEGTPAADAGLAVVDRIYEINGQPFADAAAFQAEVESLLSAGTSEISFLTERRGHTQTVTVKVPTSQSAAK